jgi:tetratricopeptide (TPR) repeat protein
MTWQEHRDEAEEQAILESWELAAAHYVEAASLLMQTKRLEDAPELAYLQLHAGKALIKSSEPGAALPLLENALQLATLIDYADLVPQVYRAQGEASAALGEHEAAIACFEAAQPPQLDPTLYIEITRSQLALGQEDSALKNLERACKLYFKAKNLKGMIAAVSTAAESAQAADLPKLARNLYKKALDLVELLPERDDSLVEQLNERYMTIHT